MAEKRTAKPKKTVTKPAKKTGVKIPDGACNIRYTDETGKLFIIRKGV